MSSSFYGTQWHEIHPQYWTKFQVWEWLQHLLDTNQLDANCIPFQEFDINGEHLCSMSLQEFTQAAGTAGQLLYSNLQHLKWNGKQILGSDACPVVQILGSSEVAYIPQRPTWQIAFARFAILLIPHSLYW